MTIDEIIKLAREAERHANTFCESISDTEQNHWFDAYNERFAALVRAAALEAAARVTGEFAQKWWSIHCASNKHMETTRKAHDDFCALQAAIRAMKEQA